ncbi:MAG: glycosyltransferase [Rickettsia endosymbiont of Ixodes persulcatus]|nr:glycosyltransferase [Rickettsia endosymbiont of Ixodes persulcatus]MCZ6914083.1 glycosyltransferase [Rickettsia endosymbiont of Ixodes persulcatus]
MKKTKLLVVIVLYYPTEKQILDLIHICYQYVDIKILLFDNSPDNYSVNVEFYNKVIYVKSKKNVGVGGAHYYAAELAVKKNFTFILFLDQDSQLPNDFVRNMLYKFAYFKKVYPRLAAIGPAWNDYRRTIKKKKNNLSKSVKMLISSGMLVLVSVLIDIGYPKKEYFIDHVDTEWCFRAVSRKYVLVKVHDIQMEHAIGEIRNFGKWYLQYHKPIRYYYFIRNSFFIFREKWMPFPSRLYIVLRNLVAIIKIPFLPHSLLTCLYVWRGLKAGINLRKQ